MRMNNQAWEHYFALEQIVQVATDESLLLDVEGWALEIARQAKTKMVLIHERTRSPSAKY